MGVKQQSLFVIISIFSLNIPALIAHINVTPPSGGRDGDSLHLIKGPVNTAVELGEDAVLPCTVSIDNDTVPSWHSPDGEVISINDRIILDDLKYDLTSNVSRTNQGQFQYDLSIRGINVTDAGTYGCRLLKKLCGKKRPEFKQNLRLADLVVIENFTLDTSNSSSVKCKVSYKGVWEPSLAFLINGNLEENEAKPVQESCLRREIVIVADLSYTEQSTINCEAFFDKDTPRNMYLMDRKGPRDNSVPVWSKIIPNGSGNPNPPYNPLVPSIATTDSSTTVTTASTTIQSTTQNKSSTLKTTTTFRKTSPDRKTTPHIKTTKRSRTTKETTYQSTTAYMSKEASTEETSATQTILASTTATTKTHTVGKSTEKEATAEFSNTPDYVSHGSDLSSLATTNTAEESTETEARTRSLPKSTLVSSSFTEIKTITPQKDEDDMPWWIIFIIVLLILVFITTTSLIFVILFERQGPSHVQVNELPSQTHENHEEDDGVANEIRDNPVYVQTISRAHDNVGFGHISRELCAARSEGPDDQGSGREGSTENISPGVDTTTHIREDLYGIYLPMTGMSSPAEKPSDPPETAPVTMRRKPYRPLPSVVTKVPPMPPNETYEDLSKSCESEAASALANKCKPHKFPVTKTNGPVVMDEHSTSSQGNTESRSKEPPYENLPGPKTKVATKAQPLFDPVREIAEAAARMAKGRNVTVDKDSKNSSHPNQATVYVQVEKKNNRQPKRKGPRRL